MSDLTTAFEVMAGPLGPTIMAAGVTWAVPFWALKAGTCVRLLLVCWASIAGNRC